MKDQAETAQPKVLDGDTANGPPSDPYCDHKRYHLAAMMDENGNVSALCFKKPHSIDLRRALWTITPGAVTCPACVREMRVRRRPDGLG